MPVLDKKGVIRIAGVPIPNPNYQSLKQTIATIVNSGRNADAQVIAQKIGRDQSKIELSWDYLTSEEWGAILSIFDRSFINEVTYFDMVKQQLITREMYVGDRTGRPFNPDELMNPRAWLECKANLIDTGRGG